MPQAETAQTPALQKFAEQPAMVPITTPRADGKVIYSSCCEVVAYIKHTGAPVAADAGCVFRGIRFSPAHRPVVNRVRQHILGIQQPAMGHFPAERKLNCLEAARSLVSLYVDLTEICELPYADTGVYGLGFLTQVCVITREEPRAMRTHI